MFKSLFGKIGGRRVDEALLEDWEETLVMSDVSLDTTEYLIDSVLPGRETWPHCG